MQTKRNQNLLLVIISIFLLVTMAKSQTHLQLILNTNKTIDSALIIHWTDKEIVWLPFKDTLHVDFKTRGIDFYHLNYKIGNGKNYFVPLFLDTGNIRIVSHIENEKLVIDKVSGSPIYEKYSNWKSDFNRLKLNTDTAALDSFLLKTYGENISNLFSFQIGSRYIDIHQNDKVKLYALLPLIAMQTKETKELFGFSFLNDRLTGTIGNDSVTLSDYPLIEFSNRTVHAGTLHAKLVILDFWFVGCLPCMEDHQKIPRLLSLFKQKQIEFISISSDESYTKWKSYLQKNNYKWQHYKTSNAGKNIITQLGITTYPTYILMDERGKILHRTFLLEELLNQFN